MKEWVEFVKYQVGDVIEFIGGNGDYYHVVSTIKAHRSGIIYEAYTLRNRVTTQRREVESFLIDEHTQFVLRDVPTPAITVVMPESTCICTSFDLFNQGCLCGYLKERNSST